MKKIYWGGFTLHGSSPALFRLSLQLKFVWPYGEFWTVARTIVQPSKLPLQLIFVWVLNCVFFFCGFCILSCHCVVTTKESKIAIPTVTNVVFDFILYWLTQQTIFIIIFIYFRKNLLISVKFIYFSMVRAPHKRHFRWSNLNIP